MAHSEHNRPKGSGIILIAIGILIFFFAPKIASKLHLAEGIAIIAAGFVIGGVGFYIAFLRKRT